MSILDAVISGASSDRSLPEAPERPQLVCRSFKLTALAAPIVLKKVSSLDDACFIALLVGKCTPIDVFGRGKAFSVMLSRLIRSDCFSEAFE